jgi:hypothetical protein
VERLLDDPLYLLPLDDSLLSALLRRDPNNPKNLQLKERIPFPIRATLPVVVTEEGIPITAHNPFFGDDQPVKARYLPILRQASSSSTR